MNIHFLQHVAFEGLASIEPLLLAQGHHLSATHLYMNQALPKHDDFDALIVMGGPMGIGDETQYPWLKAEKAFIEQALSDGKKILGICLGAQLIADVMGAAISDNPQKEIGWFPLSINPQLSGSKLAQVFPDKLEVFHWHGETFSIPQGAQRLGSSSACQHQGFVVGEQIIALQFHLETTKKSAQSLITHCGHELDNSQYVQTQAEILADGAKFTAINRVMSKLLEVWLCTPPKSTHL